MSEYFAASPALRPGPGYAAGRPVTLTVHRIGNVSVPSGALGLGDPGYPAPDSLLKVPVDPGKYAVVVTRFDTARNNGTPWTVNATLSVVLADLPEQRRGPLPTDDPSAKPSEMDVVGVDGGVVAAIDWSAYALLCEQDEEQLESFFLDDMASRPTPWNAPLPGRTENVVADQSGYGDGGYPAYGGFADDGRLVAVHIDFSNAALTPDRYRD
ncbi:DUF4241 domain-containing protein [Streptomyces sp. NBC_01142]|uniref:DUF4241 domain-containing protein n=1 Tax=Streptomyces sp. NBC_01142 TaxID=2975865 RepID=UPI00225BD1FB|nr:DUF4241 domain-containing protein [Streptomyces sp. NBC_01142]MCX4821327.1 DUF4241 domain-containing protein [Streptomyces sp. NBC_01142]